MVAETGSGGAPVIRPGGTAADERAGPPPPVELACVVVDCAVYEEGRRRAGRLPVEEALETARSVRDGFVWLGLVDPDAGQLAAVAREFELPALAVEDAVKAHQRPKLERYDEVQFAVVKPVRYVDPDEIVEVDEIEVFLGTGFVVTVRHGPTDVVARTRHVLEQPDGLSRSGPSAVLHQLLDLVVDDYAAVAEQIELDVADIEEQVFGGDPADHSERIYKLKREVLQFRRAVLPLAHPVRRLADGVVDEVPEEMTQHFRDVHDHLLRVADRIESYDTLLTGVLQADLARVAVRQNDAAVQQNQDMRKISAWAAIALVPTAIAGIHGMNSDNMPELHTRCGYFVILGLIASVCVGLYVQFRRRGWL